jgi:chromate reductase
MITIINGTNRPGNFTQAVSLKYKQILDNKRIDSKYFSLENLPDNFGLKNIYDADSPLLQPIIKEYILPADKLVIISPEYNGSFPGVLKVFFDAIHPKYFRDKKIALVGTADGRSGNLRGLDSLTNNLNYLGAQVLPFKVPVSVIMRLIENGELIDVPTIQSLERQAENLIEF